ncbi:WLM-domain-containing protein [Hymenopellis radicata]|nr:WLM-domain-containing protein [Hymenopellis radicata]
MSSESTISLHFAYRGASFPLTLSSDTTLGQLQSELEELTSVPPSLQKLLYKGKNIAQNGESDAPISSFGLRATSKIQLLGTTSAELSGLQATETEQHRIDRILRERALKTPTYKVRSTGTASSSTLSYRFHQLVPLPHLPKPDTALALLRRLSEDAAIQHVMRKHEFSVGVLTELAPHEHPQLLGLNVNAGQQIKLRLRTDRYDGFRSYREVRRVLCHELTHNVWGDHDNNFKTLNSQLNKEVDEFEGARTAGTHSLNDVNEEYMPSSELEAEAVAQVLGGTGSSPVDPNESAEDRRRRVLAATMARFQKGGSESNPSGLGS